MSFAGELEGVLTFYLAVSAIFTAVGLLMYQGARRYPPDLEHPLGEASVGLYRSIAGLGPGAVLAGAAAWAVGIGLQATLAADLRPLAMLLHVAGYLAVALPLLMRGVLRGYEKGRRRAGSEGTGREATETSRSAKVAVRYGVFLLVAGFFWWSGAFEDRFFVYAFLAIAVLGVLIDVVRLER